MPGAGWYAADVQACCVAPPPTSSRVSRVCLQARAAYVASHAAWHSDIAGPSSTAARHHNGTAVLATGLQHLFAHWQFYLHALRKGHAGAVRGVHLAGFGEKQLRPLLLTILASAGAAVCPPGPPVPALSLGRPWTKVQHHTHEPPPHRLSRSLA